MAYTGYSWHFLKISHESKVSLSHISQDLDSDVLLVVRTSCHGPSGSSGAAIGPPCVDVQKSSPSHSKETSAETENEVVSDEMNIDIIE